MLPKGAEEERRNPKCRKKSEVAFYTSGFCPHSSSVSYADSFPPGEAIEKGAPVGAPRFSSAAAAAAVVSRTAATAAVAEQEHQNDDPPPVVVQAATNTVIIVAHKIYLQFFVEHRCSHHIL